MAQNNPYHYQDGKTDFRLTPEKETAGWRRYSVSFATAHKNLYPEQDTARGQYYRPRGTDLAPLVVLIHGMGDYSLTPLGPIARALAGRGIASFILKMVFHSSRQPGAIRERFPDLTPEEWLEGYRTSVIEVRQIADWAARQPELDGRKIGLVGISLGGFISAIAMGVDQRIKAGVLIVAGGNSAKVNQFSRHATTRRYRKISEEEYQELLNHYQHYRDEIGIKGFENVTPERPSYLTDPATFAPSLKGRPLLMLNARWDEAIPREATLDLWEASGHPQIVWFPASHAGIWFWYPVIQHKITRFLLSAFRDNIGELPQIDTGNRPGL
ncbi:MAG: abhydrolase domain-containing 18 [Dehalococcoidia bacterium]|nr:MAG: abhydrolase domain-containing 18 [Dehalococcoidia bacterium]